MVAVNKDGDILAQAKYIAGTFGLLRQALAGLP